MSNGAGKWKMSSSSLAKRRPAVRGASAHANGWPPNEGQRDHANTLQRTRLIDFCHVTLAPAELLQSNKEALDWAPDRAAPNQ